MSFALPAGLSGFGAPDRAGFFADEGWARTETVLSAAIASKSRNLSIPKNPFTQSCESI